MSDLIARLRERAHLTEFRICAEAAAALEQAERERDEATRRYEEICREWLKEQPRPARLVRSEGQPKHAS